MLLREFEKTRCLPPPACRPTDQAPEKLPTSTPRRPHSPVIPSNRKTLPVIRRLNCLPAKRRLLTLGGEVCRPRKRKRFVSNADSVLAQSTAEVLKTCPSSLAESKLWATDYL